jgi:prepilin-type N-terminal cleavage/methylation domain-containing protein
MRGFSLLEMLVVLVILGMAAALVAPPLARTVERVRESGEREDIARRLGALPAQVRSEGRARAWAAGDALAAPAAAWPEGWRVVAVTPLRIGANGFCAGADVQAAGPSRVHRLRLVAPDCRVEDADAR